MSARVEPVAVAAPADGAARPAAFQASFTLKSRSYCGLLISQFLAAFNDQASHIVAFFYATDMLVRYVNLPHIDTKALVSIVTACYIAPFFLFSPLAGVLADKYSKRSIIVFWKMAEVAIMGVALLGFVLPHLAPLGWLAPQAVAVCSSVLLVSVVFLMGAHSAFFIPAKYGAMPEILHTSILSRGNGLLEGSSFLANILGTVIGGLLYGYLKSTIDVSTAGNVLHPGGEWLIGVLLLGLAVLGAGGALLMEKIPPAAPHKRLVLEPWTPMKNNLGVLRRSRPLVLATIGIAFFLFMTLYLRQSLLFQGELAEEIELAKKLPKPAVTAPAAIPVPFEGAEGDDIDIGGVIAGPTEPPTPVTKARKTEFEVAFLIGLVGLGVGIGCSLAGYFSGNRLELGLVPIGVALLVLTTAGMALVVPAKAKMIGCLIAIGSAAGLYIVPLYTLLQHRSPKESKGSLVATSNFLNVTGGLIAVVVFFLITAGLQSVMGLNLNVEQVRRAPELITTYLHQLDRETQIPRLLFFIGSSISLVMLALLWWQRPDFVLRAASWLRSSSRRHLRALGLDNIPANGQVILVTNCRDFNHWMYVISTVDRFARFVAPPDAGGDRFLRRLARRTGVMIAASPKVRLTAEDNALVRGLVTLGQGNMVGISVAEGFATENGQVGSSENLLAALRKKVPATLLPVYCGERPANPEPGWPSDRRTYVSIGKPLPPDIPMAQVRAAVAALGA